MEQVETSGGQGNQMDNGARTGQRRRIPRGVAVVVTLALLGAPMVIAPGAGANPTDPAQPPSPTAEVVPASAVGSPGNAPAMPDAVPHLLSPDNLPPHTTREPPERRTLGYLRDIWNTVRTEDVTMSDMLLLIAQRPMNAPAPASPPAVPAPAAEQE